jgi:hypothetical protein
VVCKDALVIEQIKDLAWAQYRIKKTKNDWGELGQYQSEMTFADCMGIAYPSNIFEALVTKELTSRNLLTLSDDSLNKKIKAFTLTVEGKVYSILDSKACNIHLKECGSNLLVQMGQSGIEIECFCGRGTQTMLNNILYMDMKEDVFCTPNIPFGMAAVINQDVITIKHSTLELVYDTKWLPSFSDIKPYRDDDIISFSLKKKAMAAYCDSNKIMFQKNKAVFLARYRDLLICHECGHGIIQYHKLDPSAASFAEASKVLGPLADLTPWLELLADLAPEHDELCGPIWSCLNPINKADTEWMLYVYMSDAWFYDQETRFMCPYSDLIGCVLLMLIQTPDVKERVFTQLVPRLITELNKELSALIYTLKNDLTYEKDDKVMSYEDEVTKWLQFFEQGESNARLKKEVCSNIATLKEKMELCFKKELNIHTTSLKEFIDIKAKELELL